MIIGYSLEACLAARKMANLGHSVTFISSGTLGHPCDDIGDYISHDNYKKIKECGVDFDVTKIVNSNYVHIPYEALKMVSDMNGLVRFPLNRTSFGTEGEWEEIQERINNLDEFFEVLSNSNNYINLYKKFFPKWLYDSILKHLGLNKWMLKQSEFTKDDLAKLYSIDKLTNTEPDVLCRPIGGYQELCENILDHANIKRDTAIISELQQLLITRTRSTLVVFIDNRIDQICKYSMGMFDRVHFHSESISADEASLMEELICIDEGIAHTPLKEYWGMVKNPDTILKLYAEVEGDHEQSSISPSQYNLKVFNEYTKLFKRYPNKQFVLPTSMTVLR